MRNCIVQKYGGTSVGSPDRIRNVAARIIKTKETTKDVVVVVSAMGDTTDEMIRLANDLSSDPDPREYDALISNGENISASLLAMCLKGMGVDAISLTGPQAGVKTEGLYTRSKISHVDQTRMRKELDQGKVVIVTGFQGLNKLGDITTIGRGGSDTSAVVLAAALGIEECEIYTDVDGVYTTDPRVIKSASKLKMISYDEMLELASLGAKVLHPRSVECAKEHGIVLHVRSSLSDVEGTKVKEASQMEVLRAVVGATLNEEEDIISILGVPDDPGVAGALFSKLAEAGINVDMIVQSIEVNGTNRITFTVQSIDGVQAEKITKEICAEIGAKEVRRAGDIAKLSIVGVGMQSKPGIAAKMFQVLGNEKMNIRLISTSEIKISCVIDKANGRDALDLIHKAFDLDQVSQ